MHEHFYTDMYAMKDRLAIDGVSYDEVSRGYLALYANLRLIILFSAWRSMRIR